MFSSIRIFFEQRRCRKDLSKMHALTEAFVDSVYDLAKEDGYENALNPLEVLVLSTFVVTEIYLGYRDKAFASDVLNTFHQLAAEWLFPSLQLKLPNDDVDA